MLTHYLAKVISSNFGKSDTVQLLKKATPAFSSPDLWPPNSPDLKFSTLSTTRYGASSSSESISCGLPVHTAQHWWTEAAFAACLAGNWPNHHCQCNWRVVWASVCISVVKRQTLWAIIVTMFSHMRRDFSVFVKCDTIFTFFCKLQQIWTNNFRKEVWQHVEGGKYYMGFVGNLVTFPAVKEFWKPVKN